MPGVLAGAAVASLAYGIYAGERQASEARKGVRRQQAAEQQAEAAAMAETRRAEQEENRARQQAPNIDVLLGDRPPKPGPKGIDADRLLLGRPGQLGY